MEMKKTILCVIALLLVVVLVMGVLFMTGIIGSKHKSFAVGKKIQNGDITAFYYTVASSTNPPEYQRYKCFVEDGQYKLFHEKREGDHFPLTEQDATVTGAVTLTDAQWNDFLSTLQGGKVVARSESTDAGSKGPFLYLYWKGDRDKYQAFTFESPEQMQTFVRLCETKVQ